MQLPINASWDLSTKVRIIITHTAIPDKAISEGMEKPPIFEMVDYELVIPYPSAREVMEKVSELVCEKPKGIKLYDPLGRVLLDLETGEIPLE